MKTEQIRVIEYKGQKVQMLLQGDYKFRNLDELEEYVQRALEFGLTCEMMKHDDEPHYHFYYI